MPEGPRGDPKKVREAAATEAKQAEEALRGLVRASKVNALKELRSVAERNPYSKERYSLWEAAMREMMTDADKGKGKASAGSPAGRGEIADHSMMVNSQKIYHRRSSRGWERSRWRRRHSWHGRCFWSALNMAVDRQAGKSFDLRALGAGYGNSPIWIFTHKHDSRPVTLPR